MAQPVVNWNVAKKVQVYRWRPKVETTFSRRKSLYPSIIRINAFSKCGFDSIFDHNLSTPTLYCNEFDQIFFYMEQQLGRLREQFANPVSAFSKWTSKRDCPEMCGGAAANGPNKRNISGAVVISNNANLCHRGHKRFSHWSVSDMQTKLSTDQRWMRRNEWQCRWVHWARLLWSHLSSGMFEAIYARAAISSWWKSLSGTEASSTLR